MQTLRTLARLRHTVCTSALPHPTCRPYRSRRHLRAGLWLLCLGSLVATACATDEAAGGEDAADGPPPPIAQGLEIPTTAGPVVGVSENGVRVFRGVPFAAPPVGELRFAPPRAHAGWKTALQTQTFGPMCPQANMLNGEFSDKTSEDCLTLQIWTPDPAPDKPLPVLVWIHGGAFVVGSGYDSGYDGAALAAKGQVVVHVNYRLGALGFMRVKQLEGTKAATAANLGLQDQRFALKWVHDNVNAFGGDRDNVSLFGQSAGGFSVCAHLVSPASRGLFHRAIPQSGICHIALPTVQAAEQRAEEVAQAVGCKDAKDRLGCLRAAPVKALVEALRHDNVLPGGLVFGTLPPAVWVPHIDGKVLPDQLPALFGAGKVAEVPVMLGSTSNEGALFHSGIAGDKKVKNEEEFDAGLARAFGTDAPAVKKHYLVDAKPDYNKVLSRITTEGVFTCPARRLARDLVQAGRKVYRYQFEASVYSGMATSLGAFHGAELGYLFGTDNGLFGGPGDKGLALSAAIQGYWTRFATTGDPNGGADPAWKPYDPASDSYQRLIDPVSSGAGLKTESCDLMDGWNVTWASAE